MIFIGAHLAVVLLYQFILLKAHFGQRTIDWCSWKLFVTTAFFNSLANIYMCTWIDHSKKYNDNIPLLKLITREFAFSVLMAFENVVIIAVVLSKFQANPIVMILVKIAVGTYVIGIIIKLMYFKFAYIWRKLLPSCAQH